MTEPGLQERVARLEGRVEDFGDRFDALDRQLDALERRMDERFEAVEKRQAAMAEKMSRLVPLAHGRPGHHPGDRRRRPGGSALPGFTSGPSERQGETPDLPDAPAARHIYYLLSHAESQRRFPDHPPMNSVNAAFALDLDEGFDQEELDRRGRWRWEGRNGEAVLAYVTI